MRNRHVLAINRIAMTLNLGWVMFNFMSHNLVAKEIEINPPVTASAFFASHNIFVESSSFCKISDREC